MTYIYICICHIFAYASHMTYVSCFNIQIWIVGGVTTSLRNLGNLHPHQQLLLQLQRRLRQLHGLGPPKSGVWLLDVEVNCWVSLSLCVVNVECYWYVFDIPSNCNIGKRGETLHVTKWQNQCLVSRMSLKMVRDPRCRSNTSGSFSSKKHMCFSFPIWWPLCTSSFHVF